MNTESIKIKLINIIQKYLDTKEIIIEKDTDLKGDLNFDSMRFLYFIEDVENQFHIDVREEDIPKLSMVSEIITYIQ